MDVIRFPAYDSTAQPQIAELNRGRFVALKTALGFDLGLKVSISYRVARHPSREGWGVSIVSYLYGLTTTDGRDVLAWHWHPELPQENELTHMHIYSAVLNDTYMNLEARHLPTGRIALEDVIHLCIEEFGVTPRKADWRATVQQTRTAFEQNAP